MGLIHLKEIQGVGPSKGNGNNDTTPEYWKRMVHPRKMVTNVHFGGNSNYAKLSKSCVSTSAGKSIYRDASLIRNTPLLEPFSRTLPWVVWWS